MENLAMPYAFMLKTVLIVAAAAYLIVLAGMYLAQDRLVYHADPTRTPPAAAGLPEMTERSLDVDGARLVTWYARAKPGQPTILFFHGNGGTLADRIGHLRKYLDRGRGVLIMAYRGFSGSTGSPSGGTIATAEANNVADARRAYDMLVKDGVARRDIIIHGESLGTGVATQLARQRSAAGLILDSPFTSLVERAAQLYPWLPVDLLMRDRYDNQLHIRAVHVPLLIVHGEADTVVPVAMGRTLFALANDPKHIVIVPRGGHNDHHLLGSFEAINDWIDRLRAGARKQ
jgi:uncharacterized protein